MPRTDNRARDSKGRLLPAQKPEEQAPTQPQAVHLLTGGQLSVLDEWTQLADGSGFRFRIPGGGYVWVPSSAVAFISLGQRGEL